MNDSRFSPDDPRLTAYALGQLEGDERAAIEAALREDPALREQVEQTRAFAMQLESALATETTQDSVDARPASTADSRLKPAAIIPGRDPRVLDGGRRSEYDVPRSKLLSFPQLYYVIGGLAAACVAVMITLRDAPVRVEPKYYREVLLNPTGTATASDDAEKAKSVEAPAPASSTVAAAEAHTPVPALQFPKIELNVGAGIAADAKAAKLNPPPPSPSETLTLGQSSGDRSFGKARSGRVTLSRNATTYGGAAGRAVSGAELSATTTSASVSGYVASESRAGGYFHDGVWNYPRDDKFVYPARPIPPGRDRETWPVPRLPQRPDPNTESYAYRNDNPFAPVAAAPFSTFSVDVDTASYSNLRRFIENGGRPPADAVRIEELLNYFPYHYPAPSTTASKPGPAGAVPFAASLEVADAPWAPTHRLVRIGLKAREVPVAARAVANLVFLVDVSGSMNTPAKLPLVKESMQKLLDSLKAEDRVAIVTYAGTSGLALASTPVSKKEEILAALDGLSAGGSTNGGMGIQLAYDIAKANFITGGINRVILCTDGDFNVGTTGQGDLVRLVEEKAKSGVALTVLGFGMGNLKDSTLELLADKGNGNYGYVDTRREADKLLTEQVNGTLVTVAKDVKVQVDFNPATVASYRLIGYENRALQTADFNNDAVDAGEIGAGHAVTALYEVVPVGVSVPDTKLTPPVDRSRYAAEMPRPKLDAATAKELLTVKIRYKEPEAAESRKVEFPLTDSGTAFANASSDFQFAAAVASYGMILRESPYRGAANLGNVVAWAASSLARQGGDDPGQYRTDFIDLVRKTQEVIGR